MLQDSVTCALADGIHPTVSADNTNVILPESPHGQHVTHRLFESGVILSDDEKVLIHKYLRNVRVHVRVCVCACVRVCVYVPTVSVPAVSVPAVSVLAC